MAKKIKNRNKENKKNKENESFSFENEIVIGVTKIPEPKKNPQKNNNYPKRKKSKIKKQKLNKVNLENNQSNEKKLAENKVLKNKEKNSKNRTYNKEKNRQKPNKKIIKYLVIIILLIILIICAMFSPLFNIKSIIVEQNEKISKEEIISLSQIKTEENTFKLSKRKTIKQIKQNPYIENVKIERKLPSTVVIKVEERTPAYLLEFAGSYVYISKQGYILEISSQKLELPIIQGAETSTENFIEGNRLIKEDLEKLAMVLKIMEVAQVNEISNLITRIDIENEKNFKLIFETEGKTAYIGDCSNLVTKIPTIKLILENTKDKSGEIFVNMDLNNEYPIFRQSV